jgi:two-component system, sensor histidine kinase PdtaS
VLDSVERERTDRTGELERLLAEKEQQLRESEQRFQELHHRVMNDLAGLSLQHMAQWKSAQQSELCSACIARLESTIELYGLLDATVPRHAPRTVRMAPYLREVLQKLQRAFSDDVKFEASFDPFVALPRKRASLVGLIFHEAIVNALKYAFPQGDVGTVRAELRRVKAGVELVVADDGVGCDPQTMKPGVGMQVMHHLARQLHGTIRYVEVPRGTELRLSFVA